MDYRQYKKAHVYHESIKSLKGLKEFIGRPIFQQEEKAKITAVSANDVDSDAKAKAKKEFEKINKRAIEQIDQAIENLQKEIDSL